MSRSLVFLIVVSVAVGTPGPIGASTTARKPVQLTDTAQPFDEEDRSGELRDTPLPRRAVVVISGKLVPAEQVGIDQRDIETCTARHLHPQNGSSVTALDGTVIPDSAPFGCGYGKLNAIRPYRVFVTILQDDDFDGLPAIVDENDHNPDIDGNGVPDGADDTDGDGLTDAWEYWVTRTDPDVPDSNGNGIDDSANAQLNAWRLRHVLLPVVINIYNGSGTEQEAREAVKKANLVLKQARIRLKVVKVNTGATAGDDGSGGGTAGDGVLNDAEFRKAAAEGRQELGTLRQKRGMKIAFARLDIEDRYTPGVSMRRSPVIAVVSQDRTADMIGGTIAHEFGHSVTIEGHPADGSPEDTPGNVMTPYDQGRDDFVKSEDPDKGIENLTLTPSQLEIIWSDGFPAMFGKPTTRKSPAVKREYQRGSAVDELGEIAGARYLDIHTIDIASHTDDEDVHMLLMLGDLFPDTGDVDAVYRLRFDIDDDPLTGDIGVIPGIDRTMTIFVERNDGTTGLVVGAELSSTSPPAQTLLAPTPRLLTVDRIADRNTIPNLPTASILELHVPRELLAMTAANVPGCVESYPSASGLLEDVVLVDFNRELWLQDPTLWVPIEAADRGDTLPYSLSDLSPGEVFTLFVDDTVVFSGTLDGSGGDMGDFTIRADHPYGLTFLTAIDDSGLIATSAVLVLDRILADGFEGGDASAWSASIQ